MAICTKCGKEMATEERKFFAYHPVCQTCYQELMSKRPHLTPKKQQVDVLAEVHETRQMLERLFEKTLHANEMPKTKSPFTQECAACLHKAIYTLGKVEDEVSR